MWCEDNRDLHSFPTRRSSDLGKLPPRCGMDARHYAWSGANFGKRLRNGMSELNAAWASAAIPRSEEHTSELQSHVNLVCRLLLEKKNCAGEERAKLQSENRED